ncbi:MAG: ankyrin repeat domain-containing protein [Chthoniobacter sp.]|uniref:ankyrin repeat domain-containing protein n=1 Tax=Chthoniobacter sp. TaxID=2510640 RepID=UPI0032A26854
MNAKRRSIGILISVATVATIGWFVAQHFLQWKLSNAAFAGDLAVVRRCVAMGVDIEATPSPEGLPAITAAAYSGHEEIVRFLLDHGANPNRHGMSNPLILACWRRHPAVVRLLLARGADPNARGEGTPLSAAESTEQTELVALLRAYGAHE